MFRESPDLAELLNSTYIVMNLTQEMRLVQHKLDRLLKRGE